MKLDEAEEHFILNHILTGFLYSTKEDCISIDEMIEFLNEKQRDPRLNEILYPHYDERRVMEIIQRYTRKINSSPAAVALLEKQAIRKKGFPFDSPLLHAF